MAELEVHYQRYDCSWPERTACEHEAPTHSLKVPDTMELYT